MTQTSLITFQRQIDVCLFIISKLGKKKSIAPYTVLSDYMLTWFISSTINFLKLSLEDSTSRSYSCKCQNQGSAQNSNPSFILFQPPCSFHCIFCCLVSNWPGFLQSGSFQCNDGPQQHCTAKLHAEPR